MGTSLREVIYDIGGGIKEDGKFKAVQIGDRPADVWLQGIWMSIWILILLRRWEQ